MGGVYLFCPPSFWGNPVDDCVLYELDKESHVVSHAAGGKVDLKVEIGAFATEVGSSETVELFDETGSADCFAEGLDERGHFSGSKNLGIVDFSEGGGVWGVKMG